ncbi:MAG: hypothetical protein DHS20C16_33890 [Phycisphaerae bacterium]|nr:MAG: hypothetical protein DHS20C16_33890 [Phycisphaerae bacterium]
MRHFCVGILAIVGALVVGVQPALGQSADDVFEFVKATTVPLYSPDAAFERVLVDAAVADELMTLNDARSHPYVLGVYEIAGQVMNGQQLTATKAIVSPDGFIVPENVATIAGAYRAEPGAILAGFTRNVLATTADGILTYTIEGNNAAPTYTLLVDAAGGRIIGARIGYGGIPSLDVRYDYDAFGAIARVVVEFSTNDAPTMRWALVDFPIAVEERVRVPLSSAIQSIAPRKLAQTPATKETIPKDGIETAPVEFVSSDDLIDPINLGSTSCTASNGVCFDFIGLEICFNIGLGVALNTNTALAMYGEANVEFPVEGREGEARVTFNGTTGSSSIDYSFAYDAEICASVTVPVLGTCNSSIQLAQGSVTAASGEAFFTPFLLLNSAERPVCTGDAIDPLLVGVNPSITLCDLELGFTGGIGIDPSLDYCVSGDSMLVANHTVFDDADGARGTLKSEIISDNDAAFVPAFEGPNTFQLDWNGEASLTGTLTLTPTLSVTIPGFGDVSLPLGSIPLHLGSLGITPIGMWDTLDVALCSTAPPSPFRLTATKGAAVGAVHLAWEGRRSATGYRVFRAREANLSDAEDISGVITQLQFVDSTATTGMGGCIEGTGPITYYYYVVAENACGDSVPSPVATGYVAESNALAMLSPAGLGNGAVFVLMLSLVHLMRRRRGKNLSKIAG